MTIDENVVYQNPQAPPPSSVPPPPPSSEPPPPVEDSSDGSSKLKLLMKIGIGVVVLGVVAAVLIFFVLPLFGKKDTDASLIYWGLWEDERTMKPLLDDFHRENPKITVTYEKQSKEQYSEKLRTRIDDGGGPDIFRFHNTWMPIMDEYLAPLPQEAVDPEAFRADYFQIVQDDLMPPPDNAIYGIPLGIDTLAMFVNTEILRSAGYSAPKTWIDFKKIVRGDEGITVKDQESGVITTAGAALGSTSNIHRYPDIMSMLFVQNGADPYNLSATPRPSSEALEFFTEFAKGENISWNESLEESLLAFTEGKLAIYFGYSWDIIAIKARNPELQFIVHPVPNLGKPITVASYWVEGVSRETKHKDAAFAFMKFLAKKETQQKFYKLAADSRPRDAQFGPPYARRDLAETLKDNSLIYPFVEQAKNDVYPAFFASDTHDVGYNDALNEYLGVAIDKTRGNSSSDTAVSDLTKGVDQILIKYEIKQEASNP